MRRARAALLRRGLGVGLVGALVLLSSSMTGPGGASATASGWLSTRGSTIVDSAGAPYTIRAVNWFGLETSNCAPHGLWSRSMDSMLDQMASFGFNAIRLPYANQCLDPGAVTTSIDFAQNPSLQGKSPLQVMDAVIAAAGARGMRVILDQHRPDYGAQSALWYTAQYPESRWISDWVMLAQRYAGDPTVIGADLHNEPHGDACWACGDPARDWAAAATRAGDTILAAQPNWLIIVEGIENQGNGASTWWGGGLADVAAHPITLSVPGRLVYSAHDYPASVFPQAWFAAPDYPNNLPAHWDATFGYLAKQGIAPVLLGEFGTKLQTTSDRQWLDALVNYISATGISFAYWSYNPDSGDTGGLVGDDWTTPETAKLAALAPILSPSPVSGPSIAPPSPAPPSPAPPSPAPPSIAPPTHTPFPGAGLAHLGPGTLSGVYALASSWAEGYVAQITVTSSVARSGWTVSWADAGATAVSNSWGMTCSIGAGRITCRSSGWAAALRPGQSVTAGLEIATTGGAPTSPQLTLS